METSVDVCYMIIYVDPKDGKEEVMEIGRNRKELIDKFYNVYKAGRYGPAELVKKTTVMQYETLDSFNLIRKDK